LETDYGYYKIKGELSFPFDFDQDDLDTDDDGTGETLFGEKEFV
jgi:hypothetical protein